RAGRARAVGVRLPPLRAPRAPAPAHAARAARGPRDRPFRPGLRLAPAARPGAAPGHGRLAGGQGGASRRRARGELAALGAGEAPAPSRSRRPDRNALRRPMATNLETDYKVAD